MGNSTGAALVIILGLLALGGGVVLGVLLYRLDRRERGAVVPRPNARHAALPYDARRRNAA
jgi:hypothetical protein